MVKLSLIPELTTLLTLFDFLLKLHYCIFFAKMYRKSFTKYLKMAEIAPKNCTKLALKLYQNYIEKFKNSHFISGTLA